MKTKVLLLFVLFPFFSYSQNTFLKFINDPYCYWTGGFNDNNETMMISNDGFFTTFLKLDDNADTLWSKRFNPFQNITNSMLIPASDNSMYLMNMDTANVYLSLNQNFTYQWSESFSYDTVLMHHNLSQLVFGQKLSDGNVAVVSKNIIPTYDGYAYDLAPIILMTDNNGNLLWSKKYYIETLCFEPICIAEKANGYVLFGITFALVPGIPSTTNSLASFMIDKSTGESIGQMHMVSIDGELMVNKVSEDGNILIGNYFNPFEDSFGYAFISKINDYGELETPKRITSDSHPSTYLTTLTSTSDGNIALAGTARTLNIYGGTDEGQFFAMMTDDLIEQTVWSKVYSDTTLEGEFLETGTACLSKETADNNLLFWGEYSNSNGMNYGFKVNSNTGNSSCKNIPVNIEYLSFDYGIQNFEIIEYSDIFSFPEPAVVLDDIPESPTGTITMSTICESSTEIDDIDNQGELNIFPNPVSNRLNIASNLNLKGKAYSIFNSEGKAFRKGMITANTCSIDMKNLKSGIYFLKIDTFKIRKIIVISGN
jgi:hypothetical protein